MGSKKGMFPTFRERHTKAFFQSGSVARKIG
jgi:hypothetical protein